MPATRTAPIPTDGITESRRPGNLVTALVRSVSGATPVPARRTIAYSGAFLYFSGATLVLVGLVAQHSARTNVGLAAPALGAAFTVALVLMFFPELLPVAVFPILTALGTLLIGVLAYSDGSSTSAESLLYVWVALYSSYFYTVRIALLETLLITVVAAVEVSMRNNVTGRFGLWLMISGTSLVGGLAIRNLVTQVRRLADRDSLTGLYNRRRLLEDLDRDLRRGRRSGEPLSLLILDLDEFKAFNDVGGHLEGDRHLREVAEGWAKEMRGGDMLARFGGEEFIVVMPACTLERAVQVADRLRSCIPNGQTASVGAVEWDGHEAGLGLVARADLALYEAKQAGRDRTVAA